VRWHAHIHPQLCPHPPAPNTYACHNIFIHAHVTTWLPHIINQFISSLSLCVYVCVYIYIHTYIWHRSTLFFSVIPEYINRTLVNIRIRICGFHRYMRFSRTLYIHTQITRLRALLQHSHLGYSQHNREAKSRMQARRLRYVQLQHPCALPSPVCMYVCMYASLRIALQTAAARVHAPSHVWFMCMFVYIFVCTCV
jgi:hypothetical protein